jgi:hypothetical protein
MAKEIEKILKLAVFGVQVATHLIDLTPLAAILLYI